jgi:hypothetical protein
VSILADRPPRRQGPPLNKDHTPPCCFSAASSEEAPVWRDLDDVLEELGLSLRQFRVRHGHVCLDHRGFDNRIVVDARQLQEREWQ